MAEKRRVTILLEDWEYDELKRRAGIASMSAWIKSEIFRDGGEPRIDSVEGLSGDKRVPDVGRRVDPHERALHIAKELEARANPEADPVLPDTGKPTKVCRAAVGPGIYCGVCGRRH